MQDQYTWKWEGNFTIDLGKVLFILVLVAFGLALAGCSSRTYSYESADGSRVNVAVMGTDAQVGVIDAGRVNADGSRVWLKVENLSQTDRAISLAEEALKRVPALPIGVP